MNKHCEDCIHYEKCENCEDMDNHKHSLSNAIKPKEKPEKCSIECKFCDKKDCMNNPYGQDILKEKSEKLSISKELARGIFQIALTSIEIGGDVEKNFITSMDCSGYIEKSEIQTLVEEAEEILLHNTTQNTEYINLEKQEKILETIYKLKKDHPEFKK